MTDPLKMTFEVACSPAHAFAAWTSRIGLWWPPDHTVTGVADAIVLEGGIGGRIYERTSDGVEHEWGEVTLWDPPARLAYLWHLRTDRAHATEVEIHFRLQGDASTRVEIEHRGWEQLGRAAQEWRDRNRAGWDTLLPHFQDEISKGER